MPSFLQWSSAVSLISLSFCSQSADFGYDFDSDIGPFGWVDVDARCGGQEQSPINIFSDATDGFDYFSNELSASNVNISSSSGNTLLDVWKWSNDEYISHFEASNSGHSITLIPIDALGNPLNTKESGFIARLPNIFGSSETAEEFCLHSFHFHWGEYDTQGSEHTIYGVSYPAEIHFVHYSCKFDSLGDAIANATRLEDQRVLAVVGFLYQVDDDVEDSETPMMTDLMARIEELQFVGDRTNLPNVNLLGNIVPNSVQDGSDRSESNFWHYGGSLTTPPCVEYVQWHVMDYKPKITSAQLEILRTLSTSANQSHADAVMSQNWRPVQDNINTLYKFEFDTNSQSSASAEDSDDTEDTSESAENTEDEDSSSSGSDASSDASSDATADAVIWEKLYDQDENIIDFLIAVLIILIIFCVMWVAYTANQRGLASSTATDAKPRFEIGASAASETEIKVHRGQKQYKTNELTVASMDRDNSA